MDTYRIPKIVLVDIAIILSIVMAFDPIVRHFVFFTPEQVRAVGGYTAVDSVGQTDGSGNPVYDTATINNGPGPRRIDENGDGGGDGPSGVVIDPVGHRLFVADRDNRRVLVYDMDDSNHLLDSIADHVLGKPDFKQTEWSAEPTLSTLNSPTGLAFDEAGQRLFVSDENQARVLIWDLSEGITDGMAASATLGTTTSYSYYYWSYIPTDSALTSPQGLAYDPTSGWLYVTDRNLYRVMVWDVSGPITNDMAAIHVIGQNDFTQMYNYGCNNHGFSYPNDIVIYGGKAFVVDDGHDRVLVFNVADGVAGPGGYETAVNVLGQTVMNTCAGRPADAAFLGDAKNLSVDAATGLLFVSQGYPSRVMVFDVSGSITDNMNAEHVLGAPTFDTLVSGTSQDRFSYPRGSAVSDERLYVSDDGNNRVMIFDTTALTDGDDAVGLIGHIDDDGAPIYDTADQVPYNDGFDTPESVALDTVNHRMFVSDSTNNRILVFNLDADNLLEDRDADFVLGQSQYSGKASAAGAGGLNSPSGITYDATHDKLYVADQNNNRVLVYNTAVLATGMAAERVIGQSDFDGTGTGLNDSMFDTPRSVAIDEQGQQLFVADSQTNRVMVFDVSAPGNGIAASHVLGQPDFETANCGFFEDYLQCFNTPYGVAYDSVGDRLFVVSQYSSEVSMFDTAEINDWEPALGLFGSYSGDGPSNLNLDYLEYNCWLPGTNTQPVFDTANNRLFVPDSCNDRIMVLDPDTSFTTDFTGEAIDVVGQANFYDHVQTVTQSHVYTPEGLAFNPDNNYLYVADTGNDRVMVFEVPPLPPPQFPNEHVATDVIGQLSGADLPIFDHGETNNSPNSRGFIQTYGVAVDEVGHRLFAVDNQHARVLVFNLDESNIIQDRVADYVLGQPDFRTWTDSPSPNESNFSQPYGVAYDPSTQRLFVSDIGWHRVVVFNVATITNGQAAVNVLGQPNFSSVSPATSQTGLYHPRDLTVDVGDQRLFVYEQSNNRVTVFDISGISDGVPAVNVLGQTTFDTSTGGTGREKLREPMGGVYDPTNKRLFVADGANYRVMVFDVTPGFADGEDAINALGTANLDATGDGWECSANGVGFAWDMAYDDTNARLFVPRENGMYSQVLVFDASVPMSNNPAAEHVLGQPDFTTCDAVDNSQTSFMSPTNVEYDSVSHRLYVSHNSEISVFDVADVSDNEPKVDMIGMLDENDNPYYDAPYYTSDDAPNTRGFNNPAGIALDAVHHRLFVSDYQNNRILVFNLSDTNVLEDRAADFVLGQPHFKTTDANYTTNLTQSGLYNPNQIVYDPLYDRLFVADYGNNRLLVYDTSVVANGMEADYVLGQPNFETADTGGPTQQDMAGVAGVAYDQEAQHLFVTDQGYHRVLIFNVDPNVIANYELAIAVLGTDTYDVYGGETSQTELQDPNGLAYDAVAHRLFVGDGGNNRVMVFDVSSVGDGEPAVHVLGQQNFTTSEPSTTQSGMSSEGANLFYRPDNQYLYVGDRSNNRAMVFDVADITDGEDAVDVYGQTTYTDSAAGTSQTQLSDPIDFAYDQTNSSLYVTDSANNRVLVFEPAAHGGGGGTPPVEIGFTPDRITINGDEDEVEGYNVLVNIYAHFSDDFQGTVDVLLSNTPDFTTTIPFRYNITNRASREDWPKTAAWDLCFGLKKEECVLGRKDVYARFYVNLPPAVPAFTPITTPAK